MEGEDFGTSSAIESTESLWPSAAASLLLLEGGLRCFRTGLSFCGIPDYSPLLPWVVVTCGDSSERVDDLVLMCLCLKAGKDRFLGNWTSCILVMLCCGVGAVWWDGTLPLCRYWWQGCALTRPKPMEKKWNAHGTRADVFVSVWPFWESTCNFNLL